MKWSAKWNDLTKPNAATPATVIVAAVTTPARYQSYPQAPTSITNIAGQLHTNTFAYLHLYTVHTTTITPSLTVANPIHY